MKKTQQGFAHLGLVLLLVVVAVGAYASYKVVKNHQAKPLASTTAAVVQAQTIKTKADLAPAEQTLNSQAVDSDLNPDQLNSDVNSLL